MQEYKTVHKELEINLETLKAFGSYVDFLNLHDEKISIRLIIKPQKPIELVGDVAQISSV